MIMTAHDDWHRIVAKAVHRARLPSLSRTLRKLDSETVSGSYLRLPSFADSLSAGGAILAIGRAGGAVQLRRLSVPVAGYLYTATTPCRRSRLFDSKSNSEACHRHSNLKCQSQCTSHRFPALCPVLAVTVSLCLGTSPGDCRPILSHDHVPRLFEVPPLA